MVFGHYAEGQGYHYVCLRCTPNFDCSEYEYDEPSSDIYNIETELDEHIIDMDNIKTELYEHNSDKDNIQTELDEHNSDMVNMQTEFDKHNSDLDNIQTELDGCITDIGDAQTELMGDMDDVQNELDKYISDIKSNWNLLPDEIWLKIIKAVLQQCDFKANHICFTFAALNLINKRFNELTQKFKDNLPRTY